MRPPRIVTVLEHYLPGTKAGGPVRAIEDLVACLGDEFQFDVLTADRDLGDRSPYAGLEAGPWYPRGKARVRYLRPAERTLRGWRQVLAGQEGDVLYLNSLFARSTIRLLVLRRFGLVARMPLVIAPRGELHPGALGINAGRKRAWLRAAQRLGLFDDLTWQASNPLEEGHIRQALGVRCRPPLVHVVRHVPVRSAARPAGKPGGETAETGKRPGAARLVFLSRISRKKNLDYALRVLREVRGDVELDVYGPIEDGKYWLECQAIVATLPSGIRVRYLGVVRADDVVPTLGRYHLLLFPTRGESFGHVVVESLLAGCPVLVSDQTPWRQLHERHAGWDLPLDQPQRFAEAVNAVLAMDAETLAGWSAGARRVGETQGRQTDAVETTRRLFLAAAARRIPPATGTK